MNQNKVITIHDVARKTGVSATTVSRYINKSGYVGKDTITKIANAIEELDFIPNTSARSLKTNKSNQIVLVIPDICNPFYANMYKIIQNYAKKKDYSVVLYNTGETKDEEFKAIEICRTVRSDGVIFCSIDFNHDIIKALQKTKQPVVLSNYYDKLYFDTVHSERGLGTYITTNHLISLGHNRVAYAGGVKDSDINQRRKFGYTRALSEAKIIPNSDYVFEMDFSTQAGYKAGKYFSSLSCPPTAICAANDLIAIGIMMAFNETGIRIPQDISLTGMDDIDSAALVRPGLTTVTNDIDMFGKGACQMLFDRIEGIYKGSPRELKVQRKLIIRESTSLV